MIDHANHPPGCTVVSALETALSRSSMSINAMLETAPSNGTPSHYRVVHTSAWR
jgi:hypothetical protein